MKYYIIAGETSGDLHASNLIKHIKQNDINAEFRGWGGEMMQAQGATLVKHYKELAIMGFIEVVLKIRVVLNNIKFCKKDIKKYRPDCVIFIDYPGFNLRIAPFVKSLGIKTFYYISPKIWAWKQSRVKIIRKNIDKMFVILPFEKDFYKQFDVAVDFVGNPLLDAINETKTISKKNFIDKNHLKDKPIIALLPGSRKGEISAILPQMLSQVKYYADYQFVIARTLSQKIEFYKSFIPNDVEVKIVTDQTYDLLKHSDAGLVTSGTATLETALFRVPQVVCYKTSRISYEIAKRLAKVKYISLVNLILNKPVVTELIQNDLNEKNLKKELQSVLAEPKRQNMFKSYDKLIEMLGTQGASKKTADLIKKYV